MSERVFIIFDALDECPVLSHDRNVRNEFLDRLISLGNQAEINILATSRPNIEIAHGISVEIQASRRDIRSYLDSQLDSRTLVTDDPNDPKDLKLKQEVKDAIMGAANGMYVYLLSGTTTLLI
jgi:hypothetical protein